MIHFSLASIQFIPIDAAKILLNSFLIKIKFGGVVYKSANEGWYFGHYADNLAVHKPIALNTRRAVKISLIKG
jgi:hypothetical protein